MEKTLTNKSSSTVQTPGLKFHFPISKFEMVYSVWNMKRWLLPLPAHYLLRTLLFSLWSIFFREYNGYDGLQHGVSYSEWTITINYL